MKVYIFDNQGETVDRYTIVTQDGQLLGCSDAPFHPLGVGGHCGDVVNTNEAHNETVDGYITKARKDSKWLGIEIKRKDLPFDVEKFINQMTK